MQLVNGRLELKDNKSVSRVFLLIYGAIQSSNEGSFGLRDSEGRRTLPAYFCFRESSRRNLMYYRITARLYLHNLSLLSLSHIWKQNPLFSPWSAISSLNITLVFVIFAWIYPILRIAMGVGCYLLWTELLPCHICILKSNSPNDCIWACKEVVNVKWAHKHRFLIW